MADPYTIGYESMDAARAAAGVGGLNAGTSGALFGFDPTSMIISLLVSKGLEKLLGGGTPSMNAGFMTHAVPAVKDYIELDPFASGFKPLGFSRRSDAGSVKSNTDAFRELDAALYDAATKAGMNIDFSSGYPFSGYDEKGLGTGTFFGTAGDADQAGTPLIEQLKRFAEQWVRKAIETNPDKDPSVFDSVLKPTESEQRQSAGSMEDPYLNGGRDVPQEAIEGVYQQDDGSLWAYDVMGREWKIQDAPVKEEGGGGGGSPSQESSQATSSSEQPTSSASDAAGGGYDIVKAQVHEAILNEKDPVVREGMIRDYEDTWGEVFDPESNVPYPVEQEPQKTGSFEYNPLEDKYEPTFNYDIWPGRGEEVAGIDGTFTVSDGVGSVENQNVPYPDMTVPGPSESGETLDDIISTVLNKPTVPTKTVVNEPNVRESSPTSSGSGVSMVDLNNDVTDIGGDIGTDVIGDISNTGDTGSDVGQGPGDGPGNGPGDGPGEGDGDGPGADDYALMNILGMQPGGTVTVSNPFIPRKIEPYTFESIFRNKKQEDMYKSPYENYTDTGFDDDQELMNILNG